MSVIHGGEENKTHTSAPDLLVVDLFQLLGKILTVRGASVEFKGFSCLRAVPHAFVQLLKDGEVGLLEDLGPVKSSTTGSGGARVVHVVHAAEQSTKTNSNGED